MTTLSDKMMSDGTLEDNKRFLFHIGDVKEFIRKLKEMIKFRKQFGQISEFEVELINTEIDKLAGDKLI